MKALFKIEAGMAELDRSVIDALRRGEDKAYAAVLEALLGPVYRFLLRLCHNSAVAEDLSQETFLAVWQGVEGFRGEAKFRTWVFSIAYRQFLRYREKKSLETVTLDENLCMIDLANSHDLLQEADEKRRIRGAINSLDKPYREVIWLIHLEGLNYREAAQVLDVPIGTVKSRMHAAFKQLREKLVESEGVGREVRKSEGLSGRGACAP